MQLISSRPGRWQGEEGHQPHPVLTYRRLSGVGLLVEANDNGQLAADVAAAWHGHTGPHRLETATYTRTFYTEKDGLQVTRLSGLTTQHTISVYAREGQSCVLVESHATDIQGVWDLCTRVWLRLRHAHGAIDRRWTEIADIDWTTAPTDDRLHPEAGW